MFSARFVQRARPIIAQVRKFSGDSEHAKVEALRWYQISLGMIGLSACVGVYVTMVHSHAHARTGLPYQKIRNRPFPWQCSQCDLFDYPCWKACKEGKKEHHDEEAHH